MDNITYEQLLLLIEEATSKSVFDYMSLIISSTVTLLAVGMSYFFFKNHALQVTNEKIIEKEVEKLYEAVDCLFEFCNAIELYFSMKEKSLNRINKGEEIEGSFKVKVVAATDGVYSTLTHVHKASFILRALGELDTASKIDSYRSDAIQLRKEIYAAELNIASSDGTKKLQKLLDEYASRVSELNKQKDLCLNAVAQCKKNIKSVT